MGHNHLLVLGDVFLPPDTATNSHLTGLEAKSWLKVHQHFRTFRTSSRARGELAGAVKHGGLLWCPAPERRFNVARLTVSCEPSPAVRRNVEWEPAPVAADIHRLGRTSPSGCMIAAAAAPADLRQALSLLAAPKWCTAGVTDFSSSANLLKWLLSRSPQARCCSIATMRPCGLEPDS